MNPDQACPIDHVPTPETAADDVAVIAMYFIRHQDLSLRKRRNAIGWLILAAEIVCQMSDIPYSRVEMKADLDDPPQKRRIQSSIRLVDISGTVLRVSTESGLPVIVQRPFDEALARMGSGPIFKLEDEPLIIVSVSIDPKRMSSEDCPAWLPALVSSWKLQAQTRRADEVPSQRGCPRL